MLASITSESLSEELGVDVPDLYVVVAKHTLLGIEAEDIATVLGVPVDEVLELMEADSYKAVRTIIGAKQASMQSDKPFLWDDLEMGALQSLVQRLPRIRDEDTLLKIAAIANKANRRTARQDETLQTQVAGRTSIVLTSRMVERVREGRMEKASEQTLSIRDGSMQRVTADEVSKLLEAKEA